MARFEREFYVQASPRELWPLVADTDRLNRAVGLPAVSFASKGSGEGAMLLAKASFFGLPLKWQELPFEWVQNSYYKVTRRYANGPLQEARPGLELTPEGEGTRVKIFLEVDPRYPLGDTAARYTTWPLFGNRFESLLREIEAHLKRKAPDPLSRRAPVNADRARLRQLQERLRVFPVDARIMDALAAHLVTAPEEDVVGMRPFVLADQWGFERTATLRVFLHAAREGMLDLEWDLLCPGCRKPKQKAEGLAGLEPETHCEACNMTFDADLDRLVEARFSVSPSIRKAQKHEFCVGGPMNTPHVLAQLLLAPHSTRTLTLDLGEASVIAAAPPNKGFIALRPSLTGVREVTLKAEGGELKTSATDVARGAITFHFENHAPTEVHLALAREAWGEQAASAALVTSLQEFRDLFSSDVLAPGQKIAVRNLTFLFTDLQGSTATYQQIGDAKAYSLVRDHFGVLKEVTTRNNGAIVKTIGDAVMAVFPTPTAGLRAALEMQRAIDEWNIKRNMPPEVVLKIGVHAGPAIAVNADGILDYFGTTVNQSARIEGLSAGRDVVASEAVLQAAGADSVARELSGKAERFETTVKGIREPITVWRLQPK